MSTQKRPPRPPIPARFRGLIDWKWSGGVWRPRGRIRRSGIRWAGPIRATAEEAARDAIEALATVTRSEPRPDMLLDGAFTGVTKLAQRRGTRAASIASLLTNVAAILRHFRGDHPVADISADDLQWYVSEAQKAGRHPNTIAEKDIPLLRRAFAYAGVAWPTGVRVPRVIRDPVQFLEPAEIAGVIEAMRRAEFRDKAGRRLHLPARERDADRVELLACTGLRLGELGRLRVSDCTPTTVTVTNHKDGGRRRTVPVPARARPALARLLAAATDGYVEPKALQDMPRMFARWSRRLGRPLNGRLLRHSFATSLLHAGADVATVRDLAGHRSLETTNIYVHAMSTAGAEASDALGALLDAATRGDEPSQGRS